tara:strand:+ start:154 stop:507 length:354 start_codon:yes stop_codon:yes gene_type:complete
MGMPPAQAKGAKTWADMDALYTEALTRASKIWFTFDWKNVPGDQCGAVERMAVSIAIEAQRSGLRPPTGSERFVEQMEEKDAQTAPAEPTQMERAKAAIENVMGPTDQPEEGDDLPF